MKQIYTREEWNKVRKLGLLWHEQIYWLVPTRVFQVGVVVGLILMIADQARFPWWSLLLMFCWGILNSRNEQIEGYVNGWRDGQDHMTSDISIEKTIEYMKERKGQ